MERKNAHFVECGGNTQKVFHEAVEPVEETTYGDYTQLIIGTYFVTPTTYQILGNFLTDGSGVDTTWGTSGYFGADPQQSITALTQLSDGRWIVSFSSAKDIGDSKYAIVCMVNEDGTLDTTWGTSGYWGQILDGARITNIYKILEDDDGNFHIFGQRDAYYSGYVKLASDGSSFSTLTDGNSNYQSLYVFTDAEWTDDTKTKILASGTGYVVKDDLSGYSYCNIMMIDTTTNDHDTSFTGNVGKAGFAMTFATGSGTCYAVEIFDDGKFVGMQNDSTRTLVKMLADGSALDTSWGTSGVVTCGATPSGPIRNRICRVDDDLYTATYLNPNNLLTHIDSTGTILQQIERAGGTTMYTSVNSVNDQIVFGASAGGGSYHDVEFWSTSLVYDTGFDISGVDGIFDILPDSNTQDTTDVITQEAADEYWTESNIGYSHLEGETVSILADGVVQTEQEVIDGAIDETGISDAELHVGLKYGSTLMPMRPVPENSMRKKATVKKMGISFHNTDGMEYGVDENDLQTAEYSFMKNKCEIDGLYTGTIEVSVPDGFTLNRPLEIYTDAPLPCIIRSLIPKIDVTGQ